MTDIRVLDCTLRDGGYINNWEFGEKAIDGIIHGLENAHIDIIETGFIRDVVHHKGSSVFSSVEEIRELITPKKPNTIYAAMIEYHNHVEDRISPYDGTSVDLIRVTFRRREWNGAKEVIRGLIEKGYKVCVQPVGTATYDDYSLLNLIQDVNELKPYAFYLVDTLGMMYRHDMRKFFYLIDNNLSHDICLGFHTHNNLQMGFSNAQEMIRLNKSRTIIIDSSCFGMGRGVGNLTTELLIDYINNSIDQRYSLLPVLNIVDKYLMAIYSEQRWGYDLPYFISATMKCHPNYAAHLIKKETLSVEKIEKLLALISKEKRNEYDAQYIENIYLAMQKSDIDDESTYEKIKEMIKDREILILGPGQSIEKYESTIKEKAKNCFVFSINFIPSIFQIDALFISNQKRLDTIDVSGVGNIIATSNLKDEIDSSFILDYSALLGEGDGSDNAGAMLIRALKRTGVKKIYLAGFDGFDVDSSVNYAVSTFKKSLDYDTVNKKNKDISKQLRLALDGVNYVFLTPTKYEISYI